MKVNIVQLRNSLLIAFVFFLNFEYWDPFGLVGAFSVTRMVGIVYLAVSLPFIKYIQWRSLGYYILPLVAYLFVEILSSGFNQIAIAGPLSVFNFKMIQMVIFIIFISSHIISHPHLVPSILNVYIVSVTLLSLLAFLGFGIDVNMSESFGRVYLFGENPNLVGMKAALAILLTIFKLFFSERGRFASTIFYIIPLPALIYLLISTGSRGGLASVLLGLVVMGFLQRTNFSYKIVFFGLSLIFVVFIFDYILEHDVAFYSRIETSIQEGETGRNAIWKTSIDIFLDNIFIGVGKTGALPVMYQYYGDAKDPHNVFLYVMVSSGLFGFIFFFTFVVRLFLRLVKEYFSNRNVLYILIFSILIFNMAKSGGAINKTFFWFFFAVLIGIIHTGHKNTGMFRAIYKRSS